MYMNFKKTSMNLLIVESPSKIRLIKNYLGNNYQIIASNGHLCNINGIKDINIKKDFNHIIYTNIESMKSLISFMHSVIEQYDQENIYLATDNDIEGEKIAFDICRIFGLLIHTKRIAFNEISESAIKLAVLNPATINMDIVRAQQACQLIDILIGFKVSPLLWKYINHSKAKTLSSGRCQTIALSLICDNEKKKDKTAEKQYKTIGHFFEFPCTLDLTLSYEFTEVDDIRKFFNNLFPAF